MVYVTVKEETEERLHLSRRPSGNSWAMLAGFFAFGLGAAYYGNDPIIWKIVYVTGGVFVGISCMEDWEECEFDKKTGEIRLKKYSTWDILFSPFTGSNNVIVTQLGDVIEVRVEDEKVNYFGTSHQVVLVFNSGMSLGITESFTFGKTQQYCQKVNIYRYPDAFLAHLSTKCSREHHQVADKIRKFLDLEKKVNIIPDLTPEDLEEPMEEEEEFSESSEEEDTADDFEQIDKSELPADLTETTEVKVDDTAK